MNGGRPDWKLQVRRLRDRLRGDVGAVADLRAVAGRAAEIDLLLADLDRQLERAERAAVITLVGATGAGKSTLLNAIVGRTIAREGIDRPTTRQPVIYAPRDADLADLLEGCRAGAAAVEPTVERYDPVHSPWMSHVLIDSPDLNSVAEEHREQVRVLAEHSDILVVVLHRQSVIEQTPVEFLDSFARRRALVFVLNRSDELTAAAREALLAQVRDLVTERWGAGGAPVMAISARAAQLQPQAPEWLHFVEVLAQMVRDSALAGVRRRNALGVAGLIGALFAEVDDEARPDLEALAAEVAAGTERLVQRTAEETAARWQLRGAELARLLWGEAAKRWDGPCGWALRAGSTASLGLGAGAVLARRHPLLAAGAAVGSAAAEQAQRAAERRQLDEVEALLPAPSDFARWYSEALSPARVRAARLTGDPEALGLPAAETVYAAGSSAAAEAWSELVHRQLPAAAARSWLRFLHLPLDLPVFGLAAWVIYRVAAGFVAGAYTGIDFLVNALLLGAAYLFCVVFLTRRALGLRSRRLLREAIARTRGVLAAWLDGARESVRQSTEARLTRLAELRRLGDDWRQRLGG